MGLSDLKRRKERRIQEEKKKLLDERYDKLSKRSRVMHKDIGNLYDEIRNYLKYINKETNELLEKLHNEIQPQEISSGGNEVLIEQNDTNMDFISKPPPYSLPFTDETIRDIGVNTINLVVNIVLEAVTKEYNELTGIQINMDVVTDHIYTILKDRYGSADTFKNSEKAFNKANYKLSKVSNLFKRWNNTTKLVEREAILNEYEELLNVVRDNMFSTTTAEESLERADGEFDKIDMVIDNSD